MHISKGTGTKWPGHRIIVLTVLFLQTMARGGADVHRACWLRICRTYQTLLQAFIFPAIFQTDTCPEPELRHWLGKRTQMQEKNPNTRELQLSLGTEGFGPSFSGPFKHSLRPAGTSPTQGKSSALSLAQWQSSRSRGRLCVWTKSQVLLPWLLNCCLKKQNPTTTKHTHTQPPKKQK